MTSIAPEPLTRPTRDWSWLGIRAMWSGLAIGAAWLAVAVTAVWGGDIHSNDGSTVPAAVAVAFLAMIASWAIAHYGLREDRR